MPSFRGQVSEEQLLQPDRVHQVASERPRRRGVDQPAAPTMPTPGQRADCPIDVDPTQDRRECRPEAAARDPSRLRVTGAAHPTDDRPMTTYYIPRRSTSRARLPQRQLHASSSWLLTLDHKRIAILYLISITLFFLVGGAFATMIRLELATPAGDLDAGRDLQQALHPARRHHGLLLPDPLHPRDARQLPRAAHDRRPRPGLPAAQPAELVPVHGRRRRSPSSRWSPAASTPAGRSTPPTAPSSPTPTSSLDRHRRLHHRLQLDPHRPELHRHHPQDARPGPDLVPPAAVHLVDLRDQPHHDPRHAGRRDHAGCCVGVERAVRARHLRPRHRRRPGPLPAPVLVLLATRPSTS